MASDPANLVDLEPVLVLSRSYTYFAPREILSVPLVHPMAVTLGTAGDIQMDVDYDTYHVRLASTVEDKLEGDRDGLEGRSIIRNVPLSETHGAIVLHGGKLYYKHLGIELSVVASRYQDARIIKTPGVVVPLELGQSVGLGAAEDAFGEAMWWYYVRVFPRRYLVRQIEIAAAKGK